MARIKKYIDIAAIEENYRIEEDGAVWSKIKGRYLKPVTNTAGYYHVFIAVPRLGWVLVHRLVAAKYVGQCPEGQETSHRDGDKANNHWTNMEYLTHAENIYKSYREHWREPSAGIGWHHSWATKQVMAVKKMKEVYSSDGRRWRSIEECAESLGINRRTVHRAINCGYRLRGEEVRLSFCSPATIK